MKPISKQFYALSAGVFLTAAVQAQSFNPLAEAKGFNVFTKNSLTLMAGDTHGPVATGGNLILNGATILAMNNTGTYPYGANNPNNYGLVVGGGVTFNSGNVSTVNQGYARIGNTSGLALYDKDYNNSTTNLQITSGAFGSSPRVEVQRYQEKTSTTSNHDLNFVTAFSKFTYASNLINSYAENNAYNTYLNRITIPNVQNPHITLANNKINYINLTEAELSNLNNLGSIIFDNRPTATSLLIINVKLDNGTYTWTPPNVGSIGEQDSPYILYNFANATNLTIGNGNNSVYGTLYAPGADVMKSGGNNQNGQIVAKSLSIATGEIHYYPFTGSIPDFTPLPVKSISLSGNYKEQVTNLSWNVVEEKDITEYIIERSRDAQSFEVIKKVSATMTAEQEKTYYASDAGQIAGAGTYYRVSAVSGNGTKTYSKVLKISSNGMSTEPVAVWPNPFRSTINFRLSGTADGVHVRITDVSGKAIPAGPIQQTSNGEIAVAVPEQLNSGMYFLEVRDADNALIVSKTVIKQ